MIMLQSYNLYYPYDQCCLTNDIQEYISEKCAQYWKSSCIYYIIRILFSSYFYQIKRYILLLKYGTCVLVSLRRALGTIDTLSEQQLICCPAWVYPFSDDVFYVGRLSAVKSIMFIDVQIKTGVQKLRHFQSSQQASFRC